MKMKYKILSLFLISVLSFEVIAPSFSSQTNYGYKYLSDVSSTMVKADEQVSDVFVPKSLQKVALDPNQEINVQNMNAQELKSFKELVQQEAEKVNLPTAEDTEAYKQTLLDLYDSNSSVYQDIESATKQVIKEINDNHENVLDKINGEKVLAAKHGTISVKILASTLNLAVNAACGGVGAFAVKSLVKNYGAKQAERILSRVLRDKLLKLGYKKGAAIGGIVGKIVNKFLDPGTAVAKYIDSTDKIKNNGWIELW